MKIRPILYIDIEIPFIRVSTSLMKEYTDRLALEYVMLYVEVYKWHAEFRLYNTKENLIKEIKL